MVELVTASYPIEASDAALVRSFTNDVFRVRADGQDHAFKVYGGARRSCDSGWRRLSIGSAENAA